MNIANLPTMIDLPNEAGPAAEFLVRHLYQKVDIESDSCNHAIVETANCEDDRWFWHDDNAKVLEFMSRPEVWRRFPTESSEILRFVGHAVASLLPCGPCRVCRLRRRTRRFHRLTFGV